MATTKREIHSMDYSTSGIILGQRLDHFTLSVQNPFVQDKGSLAALNLLYWDRSFLDFNSKSILYIIIPKNLKNHKVQLTFMLNSFHPNPPSEIGKIIINFNGNSGLTNQIGKMSVPFHTGTAFHDFFIQSPKVFDQDSATFEVSFPDFVDVMLQSIQVDIFQPIEVSIPRNK